MDQKGGAADPAHVGGRSNLSAAAGFRRTVFLPEIVLRWGSAGKCGPEREAGRTVKKVLLFGFETLPEILTVAGIVQQFGGEAVPVAKESCGLTLEALAQGKTGRESGVPIGGKMLVFCGLERELDGLLAALRQAGVVCLKAVLTPDNRSWTPGRLYRELQREHRAMGRG